MPRLQYLIETDVLADYLTTAEEEPSLLRQALCQAVCYTTMLNAFELFRAAGNAHQKQAVRTMLHLVRVLGFNARVAEPFADIASEIALEANSTHSRSLTHREEIILGMAKTSNLTIVTRLFFERYAASNVVDVINSLSTRTADRPLPSTVRQ